MLRILLLLLLLNAPNGVKLEKICVKEGEMVALACPGKTFPVNWTSDRMIENQTGLLFSKESLVFFSTSETQQGNYTCEEGKIKKTFDLTVFTTLSDDCRKLNLFPQSCTMDLSCELSCPTSHTPKPSTNIVSNGVTWFSNKGDKVINENYFISSVKEGDQGVYRCIRSFEYEGHNYTRTFMRQINIEPRKIIRNKVIISPQQNMSKIFVDVGSPLVINCIALGLEEEDDLYWVFNNTPVSLSSSLRIYTNMTEDKMSEGRKVTVSLVFKEVVEADLSTVFFCILESTSQGAIVNVTLAHKVRPSYAAVTTTAVIVPVFLMISVLISIKYKIHIALFMRDTLGCHQRVSDKKRFDAFIMYYTSEQGAGLGEEDRETLQSMLENHFGYSLCLFDRDVLPGQAVADAVLECVEQSRAVLLVPASSDLSSESALLSAVHEALVERQTRLIFIQTKSREKLEAQLVTSETLQLLTDLGHRVTWRGNLDDSSFFWKQLRYYLPPSQQQQRTSLLPLTV